MNDTYKNYPLFSDLEDKALQTRNRAVIMANIVEANTRAKKVSPKGAALILGYFNNIPEEDRAAVHEAFEQQVKDRGYVRK